ncbi:MAG TPA: trigger factor, partial [Acidimicrobiia bacterium]|nr:trigger factor [Acidimicrobiia bacterium]
LLPAAVDQALSEADLAPAVTPSVEAMRTIDEGVEVDVRVTVWPKTDQVPDYRDRRIEVESPMVDDERVDEQITQVRRQFAELETVTRHAHEGDFVSVDIAASSGGVEVPEATATDLLYELGSGSFVEGLDDILPGKGAGEILNFVGPLPSGFGERAGEEVDFRVLVKEVRRVKLPDLDDDWVAEVTEFDTVDELRSNLRTRLEAVGRSTARVELRNKLLDQLIGELDVELPTAIVNSEMESQLHRFAHRLEVQGVTLADYMRVTGLDREAFTNDLRDQAERSIRIDILLDAVAADAELTVSDEEFEEAREAMANGAEDPDAVRAALADSARGKALRSDILRRKALERLEAGALPVDQAGTVLDLSPLSLPDEEPEVGVASDDPTDLDVEPGDEDGEPSKEGPDNQPTDHQATNQEGNDGADLGDAEDPPAPTEEQR